MRRKERDFKNVLSQDDPKLTDAV